MLPWVTKARRWMARSTARRRAGRGTSVAFVRERSCVGLFKGPLKTHVELSRQNLQPCVCVCVCGGARNADAHVLLFAAGARVRNALKCFLSSRARKTNLLQVDWGHGANTNCLSRQCDTAPRCFPARAAGGGAQNHIKLALARCFIEKIKILGQKVQLADLDRERVGCSLEATGSCETLARHEPVLERWNSPVYESFLR